MGGGSAPFGGGGARSPFNTKSPGLRPSSIPSYSLIHAATWPQQIWAENWGLCPFGGGEVGPSNTMWPGTRPTCMPSFILMRPTVWQQCTNVTDRTGQTGQTTVRYYRANRFTKDRTKNISVNNVVRRGRLFQAAGPEQQKPRCPSSVLVLGSTL